MFVICIDNNNSTNKRLHLTCFWIFLTIHDLSLLCDVKTCYVQNLLVLFLNFFSSLHHDNMTIIKMLKVYCISTWFALILKMPLYIFGELHNFNVLQPFTNCLIQVTIQNKNIVQDTESYADLQQNWNIKMHNPPIILVISNYCTMGQNLENMIKIQIPLR